MRDEELIYLCAFRYVLGRRSYIVDVVTKFLRKANLSPLAKKLVIREINEAQKYHRLGDEIDAEKWLRLRDEFEEQLKQEVEDESTKIL
ncbi:hypothetical protein DRH29_04190 [candidate division Kazan bacterium]|uniref:Uncharacterized protein n=1 Tax=candidate division Kazan bacterium TaxID=2202143 RepID=A0A420ZC42_UNCK3|nr:MAG: hypothetical protein DRH29_04190 [candidate division Kazan bacterium]